MRLKFPIGTDTFITGMFSAFDVCNDFSVLTSICSQPGDIQWLSKVDKVDVQPSSNDVFGQVRSGNLTLTGRLGVFRINKGGFQKPGDMGNIIGTERLVRTSWDTLDAEKQYGESGKTRLWRYSRYGNAKGPRMKQHQLDVFSLPVRIMDADATEVDYEMPLLTGLLLLQYLRGRSRASSVELDGSRSPSSGGKEMSSLRSQTRRTLWMSASSCSNTRMGTTPSQLSDDRTNTEAIGRADRAGVQEHQKQLRFILTGGPLRNHIISMSMR